MISTNRSKLTFVFIVIALLGVLSIFSQKFLPYNMDEFLGYVKLGCSEAPNTLKYNHFDQGCSDYELRPPGFKRFFQIRNFVYTGNFYYSFLPFFKSIQSPVAIRLHGFALFALNLAMLALVSEVGIGSVLVASLLIPIYFFTHLVDTGPVGFSIFSVLFALWALKKAFRSETSQNQMAWGCICGMAFAFGMFIKINFIWYLPILPIFALYEESRRLPESILTVLKKANIWVALIISFILPTTFLMMSKDRDGTAYYQVNSGYLNSKRFGEFLLKQGLKSEDKKVQWNKVTLPVLSQAAKIRFEDYVLKIKDMSEFLLDGSLISHRVITLKRNSLDSIPFALALGLCIYGIAILKDRKSIFLLAMVGVTFGIACIPEKTWAAHHIVLCMPFLIWAVAKTYQRLPNFMHYGVIVFILFYWSALLVRAPQASVEPRSAREKDMLLEAVWKNGWDQNVIQWHAAWGTYTLATLFGSKDRLVIYKTDQPDGSGISEKFVGDLIQMSGQLNKGILVFVDDQEKLRPYGALLGKPLQEISFGKWTAQRFLR